MSGSVALVGTYIISCLALIWPFLLRRLSAVDAGFLLLLITTTIMTEYDYSPEAIDAYVRKQYKIAQWVDDANRVKQKSPFTPATPAPEAKRSLPRTYDSDRYVDSHHTKSKPSREDRDRRRDRDRDRSYREREPEPERTREHKSSSRPQKNRHRSASVSNVSAARPDAPRSHTLPPPVVVPDYTQQHVPHNYPTGYPTHYRSPRDSRHSSRSSSTTQVPSPTSYFQQQSPHSAPAYPSRVGSPPAVHYGYPHQTSLPKYPNSTDPYAYPSYPYYSNNVYPSVQPRPMEMAVSTFLHHAEHIYSILFSSRQRRITQCINKSSPHC